MADTVSCDRWVIDGNYRVVSDLIWLRADTLAFVRLASPRDADRLLRTMQ